MSDRYVRFRHAGARVEGFGLIQGPEVILLEKAPWLGVVRTRERFPLAGVALLAPVEPSKIVAIGLNYEAHVWASLTARGMPKEPLIFLKPPSALIGPGESIAYPPQSERVDYEAELGVVIGRTARKVTADQAAGHIFGLTCVNDVTARDLQKRDGQWSRAKGFDSFCPTGPWVITDVDYSDLLVEGILNGEVKQSGRTSQMIFGVPQLISYISSVMTLFPGDLISTGTPSDIAPMTPGDQVEVRVERIGTLSNRVVGPGNRL